MSFSDILSALDLVSRLSKSKSKYLIFAAIFTVILTSCFLFLPESALSKLGVESVAQDHKAEFAIAFFAACAFLFVHSCYGPGVLITRKVRTWRREKAGRKKLRNLTPEMKRFLSAYLIYKTQNLKRRIRDGLEDDLENIIERRFGVKEVYFLLPWAWKELNRHPDLLEPELSERMKELHRNGHDHFV